MWTRELAGYDFYHLVSCFFLFSAIGWMVESIYMSFCNKKLTNRGFMTGPFCPIYGVGAVVGYIILHPLAKNIVALYVIGALLATVFEYCVALLMQKLFGEVWWDYHDKPCNYKGMICLESTIAWGFYAVIIITFLFDRVMSVVDRYSTAWGVRTLFLVFLWIGVDFSYHFAMAISKQEQFQNRKQQFEELAEQYSRFLQGRK